WDAEFTHDWLLEEFIPEVLRWKSAVRQDPTSKLRFLSRRAASPIQQRKVDLASVASSSAIGLSLRTVPEDFDGLHRCVMALQAHFNGRRSNVEIEPALAKPVFAALDRALTFVELPNEGYVRGCLGMSPEEDLVEGVRARARSDSHVASQAAMDCRLRGLLEVMRAVNNAPLGEW
ncbi:hypothetical protein CKO44_25815, partial [Rubrivivax gelatinosus]